MNRFCPSCGKPIDMETLKVHGSCAECRNESSAIFKMSECSIRIQICPTCHKFRNLNENLKTWYTPDKPSFKDIWIQAIYFFIIASLEDNESYDFFIDFTLVPDMIESGRKKRVEFTITARPHESLPVAEAGGIAGIESMEEIQDMAAVDNLVDRAGMASMARLPAPPEGRQKCELLYSVGSCNECALKRAGYHNSVIQLRVGKERPENDRMFKEILAIIDEFSRNHQYQGLHPVSAITDVAGGVDIKLLSRHHGKMISHEIKNQECVKVKESFKVIGPDHETGGNLKRLFFSIRLFPYYPGDVFIIDPSRGPEMILAVRSRMIEVQSLKDGRRRTVKPDKLDENGLIFQAGYHPLHQFQVVSFLDDAILLMHSGDFQEREMEMPPWLGITSDTVMVHALQYQDRYYIIPVDVYESIDSLHEG
ncbi:hypothetical protein GF325_17250 [Candidatus Bathyarchaeota archaeon]|nr:hypothetical protein [Candidatus Bathyarchaeota archaeon]